MNIPDQHRRPSDSVQSRSTPGSFVEGLAASYQRAITVDKGSRRRSSVHHARDENLEPGSGEESVVASETVRGVARAGRKSRRDGDRVRRDEAVTEESVLLPAEDDVDGASVEEDMSEGSTTTQTVFNITNLLIGIGLLSLPLGIRVAGWVLGLSLLVLGAILTSYTAILLARSLDTKPEAYAYSDIGTMAYGRTMTYVTGAIFVLELLGAGSALTILFGDNSHAVVPVISSGTFKIICLAVTVPATLMPLRILSYASIIGILSTVMLVLVVFVDGIWKTSAPGSLRDPMPTDVLPSNWNIFPLSIGLLMASFGGHGIFPQVYTDMKDRKQFARSIWIAYGFSTAICIFMGVIGYLMFGADLESEITINLLKTPGFPKALNKIAIGLTAVTSLTKAPLATKSISANIDVFLGLKSMAEERRAGWNRFSAFLSVRFAVNLAVFSVAYFFPSFDRVMSLLGSAFVFLISIILPILFYIRIMQRTKTRTVSQPTLILLWTLLAVSTVVATAGTVWSFLPFTI